MRRTHGTQISRLKDGVPVSPDTGLPDGVPHISTPIIKQARICPECDVLYGDSGWDIHPESDCKYGTAERVMES